MLTRIFCAFVLITALAACKTDNPADLTTQPTAPPQTVTNSKPSISGSPAAAVAAGATYVFQPTAKDANGDQLLFSVENKPVWATFNTSNGMLFGTPNADQVGTYPGVVISVSDGAVNASLPSFAVVVTDQTGAPSIAGSPATSIVVGNFYDFIPVASDPNGSQLTFSIENKPTWAAFNESTGHLSGTPDAGDVGTNAGIVITVSNGVESTSLPAFDLTVTQTGGGTATLSWLPPAQNTDGTPLTDLAGYHVYYGTNASSLTKSIKITNPSVSTYMVADLSPATWYFSVRAYNSKNVESDFSKKVSKSIQ